VNAPLSGRVALVTGASRGIGKGVAVELGAAGATVYLTGRTVEAGALPGTIGETVAEIAALGGTGIALRCDHRDDEQVEAVFAQVRAEHGRLDVLVNNVYSSPDLVPYIGRPFWELPMAAWDDVIDVGLRSHYVATALAAPMMVERGEGLVVNVSSSGAIGYAHTVAYGVGKAALDRMTADTAHELHAHGVAVVSIWPGLVRTEFVLSGARRTDDGRDVIDLRGEGTFDLAGAESPRFAGRAVVALAGDPAVLERSGRAFMVATLAREYAFTDIDGTVNEVLLRPDMRTS
jgi:dehydrogenase/reductase SDR family protein 1